MQSCNVTENYVHENGINCSVVLTIELCRPLWHPLSLGLCALYLYQQNDTWHDHAKGKASVTGVHVCAVCVVTELQCA